MGFFHDELACQILNHRAGILVPARLRFRWRQKNHLVFLTLGSES